MGSSDVERRPGWLNDGLWSTGHPKVSAQVIKITTAGKLRINRGAKLKFHAGS
jgi:hypothetical protein